VDESSKLHDATTPPKPFQNPIHFLRAIENNHFSIASAHNTTQWSWRIENNHPFSSHATTSEKWIQDRPTQESQIGVEALTQGSSHWDLEEPLHGQQWKPPGVDEYPELWRYDCASRQQLWIF
jgi:hypothetical protein